MMLIYTIGALLVAIIHTAKGLQCFTCSATTPDTLCELDPHNVESGSATVQCNQGVNQCCMIQRQESNNKKGKIHSLFRSCQSNCTVDNFVSLTGPSYTAYYTYCSKELCNGGLGNQPIGAAKPDEELQEQNFQRSRSYKHTSSAENKRTSRLLICSLILALLSCF